MDEGIHIFDLVEIEIFQPSLCFGIGCGKFLRKKKITGAVVIISKMKNKPGGEVNDIEISNS